MTDGMDIGYVLMTESNIKIWIFNNELNEETKREYKIESSNKATNLLAIEILSRIDKVKYELNGNRSIKRLANPFNLISWLIFSLKDIF